MSKKTPTGRGGTGRGQGRKPKIGSNPLARSGFTATVEQIVFFIVTSGENSASAGIQTAADYLAERNEQTRADYAAAEFVVNRSRQALGDAADEQAVLAYARKRLDDLLSEYS